MRRALLALAIAVGLTGCQAHGATNVPTYPVAGGLIQLSVNAPTDLYPQVEYVLETEGQPDQPLAKAEPGADGQYAASYDTRKLPDGRHTIASYGLGADGGRTLLLRRTILIQNGASPSPSPTSES